MQNPERKQMYNNRRIGVIIAAGGSGRRMGSDVPKQFIKTDGETILTKAVKAFAGSDIPDCIFLVAPEEYMEESRTILQTELSRKELARIKAILSGGHDRQDSVFRGLKVMDKMDPAVEYVLIHDAARPFVSGQTIRSVTAAAVETGAAVPVVPVRDTIRDDGVTVSREKFRAAQTPQGFEKNMIIRAHAIGAARHLSATDDAGLVEQLGFRVAETEGGYENIKITVPSDLKKESRAGTGMDAHRLEKGRKLVLGGVQIAFEKGLAGHSDADVLTHAVMDALLGAAGMGDIGKLFPDSDNAYKGISSMTLLRRVGEMIEKEGYTTGNIDVTLICERPKISEHTEKMAVMISKALGISPGCVNIKGTTCEGMGFTGRGEGIAAQAVCIINRK